MTHLAPTGSEVVQTGVSGLGDLFGQLAGIAVTGISRRVDLDIAERTRTPDTAEVAAAVEKPVAPPGLASVFENLTPIQLGGLAVAAALSFALVTGRFG